VFPNEKRELSAGCTEDRTGRRAALKGGPVGCEKGSTPARPFLQTSLLCIPPNVQPTGPSCSAACVKFNFFICQHGLSARSALH